MGLVVLLRLPALQRPCAAIFDDWSGCAEELTHLSFGERAKAPSRHTAKKD
uniref:hypothetical protein n=1 Tax=Polaromonas sp. H8N TaxID=1840297 RepID=UPI0015E80E27|nr:hypothetical protein [Polaromonas sp. H8N]